MKTCSLVDAAGSGPGAGGRHVTASDRGFAVSRGNGASRGLWRAASGLLFFLLLAGPPRAGAATAMIFCNGNMGSASGLSTTQINGLRASGFTTLLLFTMSVSANGDFTYNGQTVCSGGVYVGPANWGALLNQCKTAPSSVTRIEMCIGGAGDTSWSNIRDLIAANGTSSSTVLYRNLSALKAALGIDAIDSDDESAYDSASAIQFGQLCGALGLKFTLCPYTNVGYWQAVKSGLGAICDQIYLQCYDGGKYNDPATWNTYFGGMKVMPGYWDWERDTTFLTKMQQWSAAGGSGGFLWPSCTGCTPPADPNEMLQYANWILSTYRLLDLAVTPASGFSGIAAYNLQSQPMSTAFTLSNATASSLSWSLINTSSWLSVSTMSGTLAPGAVTTTTVSLNASMATNLAPATYAASVLFSNRTDLVAVARNFTLNTGVANWPLAVSGFNAALLASKTASSANPGATAFDLRNNYCFYQQGLSGSTRGLPGNGAFASLVDSGTAFQLGPYGAADALLLGSTYPQSGTLALASPQAFSSLVILAASANGGGQGTCVLHFADGSQSPALAFNGQDWFFIVTNVAIQGFGRLRLGSSWAVEDNGNSNPNLYQTTLNLAALGLTRPIVSVTFTKPTTTDSAQTTAIFGLSGMPSSIPVQPPAGLKAVPGTNATVQLSWNSSAGATNYVVALVSGGSYVPVGHTAGTSFTVGGLVNGTTYSFAVSAVGAFSQSAWSAQVSAMPGSYKSWLLATGPTAYWPLNESAGPVAYEVVQGSNGWYAGGCTFTVGGTSGAGFDNPHRIVIYNGSSGYTQIPRLIGSTNFSIVFWLRTTAIGGSPNWYNGMGLVDGEVGGTTGDFGVALVGGKIGFGVGNPDTTLLSSRVVNNYLWHQVAVTRDVGSGAMKIYIDGVLDAANATGPTGVRTNPPSLRVGSLQTGNNFLPGSVADVAVYNQVLTVDQVATLYSAATGIFYDATLSGRWSGTYLLLSWPGNGKLLQATNVAGPWTTNSAGSPVVVTPLLPQMFYRIQTR